MRAGIVCTEYLALRESTCCDVGELGRKDEDHQHQRIREECRIHAGIEITSNEASK